MLWKEGIMDLVQEEEVEKDYNKLIKKAAIFSLILLIILGLVFMTFYKGNKIGDKASGYSLKCFQNKTSCNNQTGTCQNVTPTANEIEDCLKEWNLNT